MKVIDGNFGKEGDEKAPLLEVINEAIKEAELDGYEDGKFFMVVDLQDRMTFITNNQAMGDCLMMMKMAESHVMYIAMEQRGE